MSHCRNDLSMNLREASIRPANARFTNCAGRARGKKKVVSRPTADATVGMAVRPNRRIEKSSTSARPYANPLAQIFVSFARQGALSGRLPIKALFCLQGAKIC